MFRFLSMIYSLFLLHKGREGQKELVKDISFASMENIFFVSFFLLGMVAGALIYLAVVTKSTIAIVFAVLFVLVLIFDISLFVKIKRIVLNLIERGFRFGEQQVEKIRSRIIDVEEMRNE